MKPERWQQLDELFHSALEREQEERAAFLDEACAGDESLRKQVEALLAAHDEAGSFIESPAMEVEARFVANDQDELVAGQTIGHYKIVSQLGAGGMGEVYLAEDTTLDRKVALKMLPAALASDQQWMWRFTQEAKAASALNHPNIITIHEIDQTDSIHFIAIEFIDGETLRQRMTGARMPVREALEVGIQVASALSAAHKEGIIHRDIKPENIMIRRDGIVKVLDFGLAKLNRHRQAVTVDTQAATKVLVKTEPGLVMGTAQYMSPEQARGLDVDARTDIWSLGCVLYEMVTAQQPFAAATTADVLSAILNREPDLLVHHNPVAPRQLERIVGKALRKDLDQRYQTVKDLLIDLKDFKHELELQAEVERSVPPSSVSTTTSEPSAATTAQYSSSAEYVVSEIKRHKWGVIVALTLGLLAVSSAIWYLLLRSPSKPADRSQWVQITNLPDAVSQPALSADGRMVTFIRGPDTFVARGEIYVKMLPNGEAVQLTRDKSQKMSPVFSPDGSQIAYTVVGAQNHWDTWITPVLAGSPRLWLPNASGLVWSDKGNILFSEIKNNDIHMAVVAADESRAAERDIYVPSRERGMAHRSYPSPDGKRVLVVEMDRSKWLPCRLVPMDGSSPGRQVGPPGACTAAAWSPDGKWMYLNSAANGAFHIWRQRFPDGPPEQITSGPTAEEGIAMMPDGRSFITAVGMKQSSVWVHNSNGEGQISLEGYSYNPKFTPDGKRLCYLILKDGSALGSGSSELRVVELESGRNEVVLPGFAVVGYDISSDGQRFLVSALDHEGKSRLWLTSLGRLSPPRELPNVQGALPNAEGGVQGGHPLFGPDGEILFIAPEGDSLFLYRVHEDGTALRKVIEQPIAQLISISPDKQWVVVKLPGTKGSSTTAFPLQGGSPVHIIASGFTAGTLAVQWSPEGGRLFIPVPTAELAEFSDRTYVIPLPRGQALPQIPVGGLRSEAEIAKLPGALRIDALGVTPGPAPGMYAFVRVTLQRNLFSVPLP